MKLSIPVLLAEWRRAGWSKRYFLLTHLLANALMAAISVASVASGAFGHSQRQMILLGAAVLCGGQAMLAWNVLQRRFKVRYSLW